MASSLLESVLAITIISVCGLIAVKVYASVLDSSYSYDYLYTTSAINNLIFQTYTDKKIEDENFELENGIIIYKTVINNNENFIEVNFLGVLKNDSIKKAIKIYN